MTGVKCEVFTATGATMAQRSGQTSKSFSQRTVVVILNEVIIKEDITTLLHLSVEDGSTNSGTKLVVF
jgi:hypothetical protein